MTNRKIESNAEEILKQFKLLKTPVQVETLASKLEISIELQDLDESVSGFLVKKGGKNIIGLNENHHPVRKRFTIAHEIGHFILHVDTPLFVDYYKGSMLYRSDDKSRDYKIEKEANSFAAALLMPKSLISKEISKLEFSNNLSDDDKVLRLSRAFQVSNQAMDYRLKTLGYYDYGF